MVIRPNHFKSNLIVSAKNYDRNRSYTKSYIYIYKQGTKKKNLWKMIDSELMVPWKGLAKKAGIELIFQ